MRFFGDFGAERVRISVQNQHVFRTEIHQGNGALGFQWEHGYSVMFSRKHNLV